LDFDEETDYRKIKPDYTNGTNAGPGTYEHTALNSVRELQTGKNSTFNVTQERFARNGDSNKNNTRTGPGAYDESQTSIMFKRASNCFRKTKDPKIPFGSNTKKMDRKDFKVPGVGKYEPAPGLTSILDQKNAIHKLPSEDLAVTKNPRANVPHETYAMEELGPGAYEDAHATLKIKENLTFASFRSDIARLEPAERIDPKFGSYEVQGNDITERTDRLKLNVYAFNNGTGRFDPRNKKMNILTERPKKEPFEDALGATNRPKDRFKGKDGASSQEVKLVYNSSYGGGFKGGLVEEKEAVIEKQIRSGFGVCSERFENTRMAKVSHIGPGTYITSRGGFDKNTFNIRYS
jgi:hypothetical protein